MAFSDIVADFATGANINAGDDKTVSTTTNGAYTQGGGAGGTDLFTAAAGTPFSSASVDDLVASYVDGATVATFLGRITAVNGGGASVDISLTKIAGTRPTTAVNGRSATIGGKFKGPNGASGFPLTLTNLQAITNTGGDQVRLNVKNGTNYAITAAISSALSNIVIQGYTSSFGDGGKWILDGGTSGASYVLLTMSGTGPILQDAILQNNGATGSATGLLFSGNGGLANKVIVNNVRGHGFDLTGGAGNRLLQCKAYACNQSNTAAKAGISVSVSANIRECTVQDNTGSNTVGILYGGGAATVLSIERCIIDTNGSHGINVSASGQLNVVHCNVYANAGDGIRLTTAINPVYIINNILTKNGGYGINGNTGNKMGMLINNAYGAGTQVNTSGDTNAIPGIVETGKITLGSNLDPYTDAPNSDFRLTNVAGGGAACRGTGYGAFTDTGSTVSYPDVGAVQHLEVASGGGSYSF